MELTKEQWKLLRENGTVRQPFGDHGHFKTPSGKIRIVNQEEKEPVPCYKEPYGGAYPLSLISIPDSHTLNSIFLERRDLVQKRGPAALILHPLDAAERGIRGGRYGYCMERSGQGRLSGGDHRPDCKGNGCCFRYLQQLSDRLSPFI